MLGNQERSLQIDIQEPVPHRLVVVVDPHVGAGVDAGAVDEDIEATELIFDEPNQGGDATR